MRVRSITYYFDKELNRSIDIGSEYTVSEARGKILIDAKVAIDITPTTPETPKKGKKK